MSVVAEPCRIRPSSSGSRASAAGVPNPSLPSFARGQGGSKIEASGFAAAGDFSKVNAECHDYFRVDTFNTPISMHAQPTPRTRPLQPKALDASEARSLKDAVFACIRQEIGAGFDCIRQEIRKLDHYSRDTASSFVQLRHDNEKQFAKVNTKLDDLQESFPVALNGLGQLQSSADDLITISSQLRSDMERVGNALEERSAEALSAIRHERSDTKVDIDLSPVLEAVRGVKLEDVKVDVDFSVLLQGIKDIKTSVDAVRESDMREVKKSLCDLQDKSLEREFTQVLSAIDASRDGIVTAIENREKKMGTDRCVHDEFRQFGTAITESGDTSVDQFIQALHGVGQEILERNDKLHKSREDDALRLGTQISQGIKDLQTSRMATHKLENTENAEDCAERCGHEPTVFAWLEKMKSDILEELRVMDSSRAADLAQFAADIQRCCVQAPEAGGTVDGILAQVLDNMRGQGFFREAPNCGRTETDDGSQSCT